LLNLAVPFFFLSSGYLLAIKMDLSGKSGKNLERIKRYVKNFLKMYIIWSLIYLPLALYSYIDSSPIKAMCLYARGLFFIGEHYNSWQLWYLLSSIYALIAIWFVFKTSKPFYGLLILSFVAGIFSIGITVFVDYDGHMAHSLDLLRKLIGCSIRNGRILNGMVYIPLGMILTRKKIFSNINWIVFIVGFMVNVLNNNVIISYYLLILEAVSLFGIVVSINLKDNPIYERLRNMSTAIYLVHMYIWTIYYYVVYGAKTSGIDSFIATSVISLLIAWLYGVFKYSKKKFGKEYGNM
jgi:hypothetical protein